MNLPSDRLPSSADGRFTLVLFSISEPYIRGLWLARTEATCCGILACLVQVDYML
jgi:hypothetical protein